MITHDFRFAAHAHAHAHARVRAHLDHSRARKTPTRLRACRDTGVALALLAALSTAALAAEVRVMHEQQVLLTSPANDIYAAAIDGDVIVLGAPTDASLGPDTGALHVFERPPGGAWVQTAWLQDRDAEICDRFGRAVDVEGGTLVANHWNWPYDCDTEEPRIDRQDGMHAFERGAAGWTQTFGREKFLSQGAYLAFDGISLASARDGSGAEVMTRAADGTWSGPQELRTTGAGHWDDETAGAHLDMHNGLLVIGDPYETSDGFMRPGATIHQRRADGNWQMLANVQVPMTPQRRFDEFSRPYVSAGPRQRISIDEWIFERLGFPEYTESVSLRPACAPADASVEIQLDEQSALALVRTRPQLYGRSLEARGITLHLYDRIALGDWKLVAQLVPSDNTPANATIYDLADSQSFAIDSRTVVSNHRTWDASAPTVSYVFSTFDACLGHRGNWVELNPQRWAIGTNGGRTYSIVTSDYSNQAGDRPGEYALVGQQRYGDFDFSLKARSDETLSQYSAADYVVIFGYQDDDNYYYMMFSRYRDNNELFKVVNGVRQRIARAPRASFLDNAFHRVDVMRRGDQIRIRFDNRDYLTVTDDTFGRGAIGVGSYNDAASFDDIGVIGFDP